VPPSSTDFALVVRQHAPGIVRALRRLGVRDGELLDVAAEVFVTLHRALAAHDGHLPVRALAYRVAVHAASEHRKRSYRRPETNGPPPDQTSDRAASDERLGRLDRALERLAPVHREVLVLAELEALPWDEVVAALGVPEKTATGRLRAARGALCEAWGADARGDTAG
jgi:RNA polymerase sigma-70 factor (ECF subfamily)